MDHSAFFDELTKIAAVVPYLVGGGLGALGGAATGALTSDDRRRGAIIGGITGAMGGLGGAAAMRHLIAPTVLRHAVDKPLRALKHQQRYWRPGASDAGLRRLDNRELALGLGLGLSGPLAAGATMGHLANRRRPQPAPPGPPAPQGYG